VGSQQHIQILPKNLPAYKADVKNCAQAYPESPDIVYLKRRITYSELKGWR
jgi:hypothetical protein